MSDGVGLRHSGKRGAVVERENEDERGEDESGTPAYSLMTYIIPFW